MLPLFFLFCSVTVGDGVISMDPYQKCQSKHTQTHPHSRHDASQEGQARSLVFQITPAGAENALNICAIKMPMRNQDAHA